MASEGIPPGEEWRSDPSSGIAHLPRYSVVVPVFNSQRSISEVTSRTLKVFEELGASCEIILVNDGSTDESWDVLRARASDDSRVTAVNLLRNYGQHSAILCGLRLAAGEYAITLDDDLQNPPEEVPHLIRKASEGHDLVFGRFKVKRHSLYRRWGSLLVGALNRRVFRSPEGLALTNFRILHRSVIDRICSYRGVHPYISGLAVMYSSNPANIDVDHHERAGGKSNYNLVRITRLVARILFAYSTFPLRAVVVVGVLTSLFSILLGGYYLIRGLVVGVTVPGWTSLVVLLSFLNGITMLILGMLGEYLVRILNQTSGSTQYEVKEVLEARSGSKRR